jgi:hypothetical protein
MVSPSGRGGYGDGCRLDVGGSVGGCALGMVHPAAWVIGVLRFGGRGKAALAFSPQAFGRAREAFPGASTALVGLQTVGSSPSVLWAFRAGFLAQNLQTGLYKKTKRAACSLAALATSGLAAASSLRSPRGLQTRSDQGVRSGSSMWALCLSRSSGPRSAPLHGIPHRDGGAEDPLQRR